MTQNIQKKKENVAKLSVFSNTLLIILKLIAGIFSGSVSIISEAIHSAMDLVAAIIAYISVKVSSKPPDEKHPYGHGKFENVSGVIEALLIFVAAGWIIYEAVEKIIHPQIPDMLGLGFGVMVFASVVNIFVSRRLYKIAKEADSVALEADALHLKTDVYTSAGVALGLVFIWITGNALLDPIVAILVAILILFESFNLLQKSFRPLMDVNLPEEEINTIKSIIAKSLSENMSFHLLRTRKSGHYRYIDFHLEVPENMSVRDSHHLCDQIENDIKSQLKNTEISIHIEPS